MGPQERKAKEERRDALFRRYMLSPWEARQLDQLNEELGDPHLNPIGDIHKVLEQFYGRA